MHEVFLPLTLIDGSTSPGVLASAMPYVILVLALIAIAISVLHHAVAVPLVVFPLSFVVALCPNIASVPILLVIAPVAFIYCTIRKNVYTSALFDLGSFAPHSSVDCAIIVFKRAALLAVLPVDVGRHWVLRVVKWTQIFLKRLQKLKEMRFYLDFSIVRVPKSANSICTSNRIAKSIV